MCNGPQPKRSDADGGQHGRFDQPISQFHNLSPVKLFLPVFRLFLGMFIFYRPQHPSELPRSIDDLITAQMLRSKY
jgi:hypothetical protein